MITFLFVFGHLSRCARRRRKARGREREREEETLSLFALQQRARGKEREERSMISFDSVQWRARARALSTLSGVHIFHCNRCLWSESCARHYGERPRCELKGIGVGTAAHRSIPPRRVTRKSSRSAMPCHGYDSLNTRRRGQSEDDATPATMNNGQRMKVRGEAGGGGHGRPTDYKSFRPDSFLSLGLGHDAPHLVALCQCFVLM